MQLETLLKSIFFCVCFTVAVSVQSQVGIGTTGIENASAKLEVKSETQGFLPPRMTAAQRGNIASPVAGLMVYQTDATAGLYYHNGSGWIYVINSTNGTLPVANGGTGVTSSTGSGSVVLSTSPTLTTPTLGVASATSINKVAVTAPASGATLTIADGKTLTANNSITLAGTDGTTMTFPSSSATLASLAGTETLTNKTITGLVASTITGGTSTTSTLTYKTTTGAGASGADHIFQVGNNGATEAMRITNAGNVGIGTNSPTVTLEVGKPDGTVMGYLLLNPTTSGSGVEGAEIQLKPAPTGSGAPWVIDQISNSPGARFRIFNGNVGESNGLTIRDAGNVGIGNSSPAYKLDVNGDINAAGVVRASGTALTSDARLKNVIHAIENDDQMSFVQFRWKKGDDTRDHYGYLAQEVQKVLPDAVYTDSEGMMAVNYSEVHSFKISNLEREIKELKQVIEELKKKGKRRRSRR